MLKKIQNIEKTMKYLSNNYFKDVLSNNMK